MKKIIYVLVVSLIFLTACDINNTPNSKVEELLSKYQMLDDSISINASDLSNNSNLDDDTRKRYEDIIKNQYRNMSYEIKDDKTDGDIAVVTTEIKVVNFRKVLDNYNGYSNLDDDSLINDLGKEKEKIVYTIDFELTRDSKGEWKVNDLSTDEYNKLLGIY